MWSEQKRRYTRCRLHGGLSTGAKTPEGRERAQRANYKHGDRTKESIAFYKAVRLFLQESRREFVSLLDQWREAQREIGLPPKGEGD